MRASLVVFALVVLVGIGFWLGGDQAPVAPPDAGDGAGVTTPAPTPAPAQGGGRTAVDAPAPPVAPTKPAAAPTDAPAPPATAPAAEPNVLLAVRDMVSRQPVAAFRWRFQNSRGTWKGEGAEGKAAAGELTLLSPPTGPALNQPLPGMIRVSRQRRASEGQSSKCSRSRFRRSCLLAAPGHPRG